MTVRSLSGVRRLITLLLAVAMLHGCSGDAELVQNGLQQFTICGKARTEGDPLANRIMDATRGGARVGTWSIEKKAGCDVYRHFVWD